MGNPAHVEQYLKDTQQGSKFSLLENFSPFPTISFIHFFFFNVSAFFLILIFTLFYFTVPYWFCHTALGLSVACIFLSFGMRTLS